MRTGKKEEVEEKSTVYNLKKKEGIFFSYFTWGKKRGGVYQLKS